VRVFNRRNDTATGATRQPSRGILDLGESKRAVMAIWFVLGFTTLIVLAIRPALLGARSIEIILTLSTVTAVVGLGQGTVIFVGGIDLSIPWTMTSAAVMFAGIARGSDSRVVPALSIAVIAGLAVGVINGIGIVRLGLHPVVMTLAMNVILQGAIIGYTGGYVTGSPPPAVAAFMTPRMLGVSPAIWALLLLAIAVSFVFRQTVYGRYMQAVGLNATAARLAGTPSGAIAMSAYVISGAAAALAGVMLSGIAGQSYLGMGDPYLLTSIAVVALGGAAFSGGRGHFLGTLAAAILLSLLLTVLVTFHLPEALKQVVLGGAILGAVIAGRLQRVKAP
jgi:ribose transport system permease protein